MFRIRINDKEITVPYGSTVAAAIYSAGPAAFRRSVTGEARFPLCGMGICFECRVTINGMTGRRSCQILAEEGMVVATDE